MLGIGFADAGMWNVETAYDGVHFSETGHAAFAKGLLNQLLQQPFREPFQIIP